MSEYDLSPGFPSSDSVHYLYHIGDPEEVPVSLHQIVPPLAAAGI